MADRYDDRTNGRDRSDQGDSDRRRERERMDRDAQSRDDRSGYVKDVHNQLRVQQDVRQAGQNQTGQGGIMGQQMQGNQTAPSGESMQSNEVTVSTAPGTSNNGLGSGQSSRNPRG